MPIDPRIALAGFAVGLVTGVSGIGGSSLLAPILIFFFGVNPTVAVGTDLLYSVPTKLLASAVHLRQRTVDLRLTLRLAAGGVPGTLAGLALFAALRAHIAAAPLQLLVRHLIGGAIVLACVTAVVQQLLRVRARMRPAAPVAIGFVVGVLAALTSIGSGSITLPLLLVLAPGVALRALIGTEIVFATLVVTIAAAGHSQIGDVSWPLVGSLLIGSLPGVYAGSRLCGIAAEGMLRGGVLAVLAYAGLRLL